MVDQEIKNKLWEERQSISEEESDIASKILALEDIFLYEVSMAITNELGTRMSSYSITEPFGELPY